MDKLDLKFYWSVFLRRLPYFLVVLALLSAIGVTVAMILPPVYRSSASMLVEPQQIPGDLAQSTVPVNPFEQVQIIEQRLMTRANLIALADRIGLYAEEPELSVGARVADMHERIEFIGFEPDVTRGPQTPGATIIGVAFNAPTPEYANKGANELVNLVLEENVRLRTGRADDTLQFFESEVERLQGELERKSEEITAFKTANFEALPDSLVARRNRQILEQERLLSLEREESALRNQRATVVWVFERTGRSAAIAAMSPEEEQLESLKSELLQQSAIYAPTSPRIRMLTNQVAALEKLVAEQQAARAVPDADGQPAAPASSLDLELAPIDARLEFIAQDKALIEETLAELDASIQATPANEAVMNGLDRELANLNEQYNAAVASLGQAKVGERIEVLSKGERFSLIEQPTLPGSPVRPKRLLIASAGIVGGLGAGLGFVVLLEMLNRSIRRPLDLSEKLGLEPFATVPYIRTVGEVRRKRSLVVLALVLVAVAIPAGLLAVHTLYLPLDLVFSELLAKIGLGADVPSS
jgi:polysaccharide chain length determinant protein (PEP-CTERM system associated)